MKTKLLLLLMTGAGFLSYGQETTTNRLIGASGIPGFVFYADDSYDELTTEDGDMYNMYAIAVNPDDSLTYALLDSDGEDEFPRDLYRVNPFTGDYTRVYDFEEQFFNSGDIGDDGLLYLITGNADDEPGRIFTLNIRTLDFELLFETGLRGPWGLEYNNSNNSLYLFQGDDGEEHFVYRYDPESGEFTEMHMPGMEETEVHGAFYDEEEDRFLITEYYGDLRETVNEEYNETESLAISDEGGVMDVCIIQTLRAEGTEIEFDACPGDDSTKIQLLYEVNDVEWYRDGELIADEADDLIYAKETGDYQALMQIGEGESDYYMWSEVISVSFLASPVVTVTQEEGDYDLCIGEEIELTGVAPGGGSVVWLMNGEEIDDATGATFTVTEAGIYNQLKTNMSGCSDSADVSIEIFARPNPEVLLTTEAEVLCGGETGSITGIEDASMQWYKDGEMIDGATLASITFTEGGVYNQMVTTEYGCMDSAAVGITIVTAENPVVEITSETSVLCPGSSIELTGSDEGSQQWFMSGDEIDGETGSTLIIDEAGTYNQTVINEAGCSGMGEPITILDGVLPTVTITNEFDADEFCDEPVLLEGIVGETMQWTLDGTDIPGATSDTYDATAEGTYNQIVTNEDGCVGEADAAYVLAECTLGLTEENLSIAVNLYPNPVVDVLNIESSALINSVVIYDIAGNIAYTSSNLNSNLVKVNYANLASGMYVVKISTNEGMRIVKTQK